MNNKMTLKQRINAGFILAMAFLLVFASNRLNRRNFANLEQNVSSVFEDRVVVQEYIYRLNNIFHRKELSLAKSDENRGVPAADEDIENLLSDFASTKLTRDESRYLNLLKANYAKLVVLETKKTPNQGPVEEDIKLRMANLLGDISANLDRLSEVQLSEGKLMIQMSKKSLSMNQMLSRLEIAFLVIIGLLFLLLIVNREIPGLNAVEKN
ncbi:hypothetical protein [Pareuzebyella sediminis]|uniref:hypothetical protein n=1 Tax=Pareuzebyella sediminis TaxID=2607998 RepID=UPI0011EDAEEF|nr:hypothetical protein [Pareuzebyella sediminis]